MSADRQALPVTVASHPGLWRAGPSAPPPPRAFHGDRRRRLEELGLEEAPLNLLKGVATYLGGLQRQPLKGKPPNRR